MALHSIIAQMNHEMNHWSVTGSAMSCLNHALGAVVNFSMSKQSNQYKRFTINTTAFPDLWRLPHWLSHVSHAIKSTLSHTCLNEILNDVHVLVCDARMAQFPCVTTGLLGQVSVLSSYAELCKQLHVHSLSVTGNRIHQLRESLKKNY